MASPQPPSHDLLADAAVRAAHASGKILLRGFGKALRVSEKEGAGLVTPVDLASQRAAIRELRRATPEFGFLAEESGLDRDQGGGPRGRWILDPLDGTTNYIHGFPMFCVSIAAEWDGELLAGVVYHPVLGDTYVAKRGKGAFLFSMHGGRLKKTRLHVSKTSLVRDSLLTTGFTYRKDQWLRAEMEAFERLSAVARAVRRPGSAALDLAYTARGVFDGFWERRLSPWDVAAGMLLVREAGGKVTDFLGNPSRIDSREIVASNSALHEQILASANPARSG